MMVKRHDKMMGSLPNLTVRSYFRQIVRLTLLMIMVVLGILHVLPHVSGLKRLQI